MQLTDAGVRHFEAISFYLALTFAAALGFRAIWNGTHPDFPRLPRLSLRRSMALMVLAGLLAWPVLAMTAGGPDAVVPSA